MADEELDLEEGQENINKTEKRIKDLSEKVRLTASERDELKEAKEKLEQEKEAQGKEVEFYKSFSTQTSKFPAAAEYQDKIWEKVKSGYDLEDATISILAREGKYNPPEKKEEPPAPKESPAGGSANTTLRSGSEKSPLEMSQEERRAALIEAEKKGELSVT